MERQVAKSFNSKVIIVPAIKQGPSLSLYHVREGIFRVEDNTYRPFLVIFMAHGEAAQNSEGVLPHTVTLTAQARGVVFGC